MRVVLVGNRLLAKHVLRHLLEKDVGVVGAVAASGEAARCQAGHASFEDLSESYGFELIETTDVNRDEVADRLARLEPDLCICPGWHQIIEEDVLSIPTDGFLGYHASLLPEGRGGAPVNWAIIHGEDDCGISLFYYTPGVDAGDVVAQTSVPIQPRDDVDTVLDRLAHAAVDLIEEVRTPFERGTVAATPQSLSDATYRPRRQPQDGLIDWTMTPRELVDWIRALTRPYPGAYTFFDGHKIRVWRASVTGVDQGGCPGTVLGVDSGAGVTVATGDGGVRVERLQFGGEPPVWADEALGRYALDVGARLGRHHAPDDWLYTGIRDGAGGTYYRTNLQRGEEQVLTALVIGGGPASVEVRAILDDELIHAEWVSVDGGTGESEIVYGTTDPGTRTLSVSFHRDGQRVDVRRLKLFVTG